MSTVADATFLDKALTDLETARRWSPRTISKLEALINSADPWALYRVNPLTFAKERGIAEAESIDLFLHATHLGLFAMDWRLICPVCSDTVIPVSSSGNLARWMRPGDRRSSPPDHNLARASRSLARIRTCSALTASRSARTAPGNRARKFHISQPAERTGRPGASSGRRPGPPLPGAAGRGGRPAFGSPGCG